MASVTAADYGKSVLLLEKNDILGKKLLITGKGRCNVTNNCPIETLMENIPTNPRFLYSAFSTFDSSDTISFFERLGVPLKTERGNRVFPVSDNAKDIVNAFESAVKVRSVTVKKAEAKSLIISDGCIQGVKCAGGDYESNSVLIATGGRSYPKTGSTGAGYEFARQAGHTVTPIRASLVPMTIKEKYCSEMMGLSLRNVKLYLDDSKSGKQIYCEQGEMLFTHFGISGPIVLSAGSHIREMQSERYKVRIDMKPALDDATLDARIQRDFSEYKNRDFANSLGKLLPAKMIPVVVSLSGIQPEKKVNSVTKEERRQLVSLIKAFPLTVTGFRPVDEAIITGGGVSVKEIDPKTMQSKLVKGLYFAGEVIDCDAYTGGFNLQIAISTGCLAGINM